MQKLRIGIVGCGAIGSSLAKIVQNDLRKNACLTSLYDVQDLKSRDLSKKIISKNSLSVESLDKLIYRSDLVVEAASAKCSADIARKVLSAGKSVMVMSVGGLIDNFDSLCKIAAKNKCKVYVPSGAISGIDALKAAKAGTLKRVILTTTKNPLAFKGVQYIQDKGIKLEKIKKERVLFSGKAMVAVKLFPQNVNVAAVLSLAGIGADKTEVRIIASPKVNKNIHEICIESAAGNIFTRTENILHPDNPKTSYLAVLSAAAMLKSILEPIRIGT
jgi:aspartate dehydrogenase